jgi:flavin reductase (DIM6/NTAB) family NADH-FMN oxidoreductase RutF
MRIDPAEQSASSLYYTMVASITPRPIAWVATRSKSGARNLAPFSFFTGIVGRPPTLLISVGQAPDGGLKDTARNIIETEQFIINVVPHALGPAMVHTSGGFASDVDEFEAAGLEAVPGDLVAADRVVGSPIQFECRLFQTVPIHDPADPATPTAHLFIGQIVCVHVDDAVIGPNGRIDAGKLDTIGRLGGADYSTTRDRLQLRRPVVKTPPG